MEPLTLVLCVLGLGLLIAGADLLVRGASGLVARAGIAPLVVGLTVVAFGTSSPKLAVSIGAAWTGDGDIALGTVVGSTLCNGLGVLGLACLLSPDGIAMASAMLTCDIPVALAAAHDALPASSGVMRGFVLPLTAVTVLVLAARAIRERHSTPSSRGAGSEDATR